ncbi:hypothetical protein [Leuconostoc lactis]|uniref:hypothetical protein n=1 Tax=Leuconostoc lactis TaxID=1246 RepID=UPI001898A4D3|nr:hypothetical protein [Leuconostoc lactis]MDI6572753.1 hypothetical protein [Leuconostoc lactis]
MTYLFIALGFLFLGFVFNVGTFFAAAFEKLALMVVGLVLTYAFYIATAGFGLVWIVWLFKNI